jgi:hypothetical protein
LSEIEARVFSCNIGIVGSHRNTSVTATGSQMLAGRGSGPEGATATTPGLFMAMGDGLRAVSKGKELGRIDIRWISGKLPGF